MVHTVLAKEFSLPDESVPGEKPYFTVQTTHNAACPLLDDTEISRHWKEGLMKAGRSVASDDLLDAEVSEFLLKNRERYGLRTFCAVNDHTGEVLGHIHAQIWNGPVPIEVISPDVFRLGTVWGLKLFVDSTREGEISKALVDAASSYLQTLKCKKVVTWALEDHEKGLLVNAGFGKANMLTCNLQTLREAVIPKPDDIYLEQAGRDSHESNTVVARNWKNMWIDCGIPEAALCDDLELVTRSFIAKAEAYQTFIAKKNETAVASLSCQVWKGPMPQGAAAPKVGTIWAVYVHPDYRRQGIATSLMYKALTYLRDDVGCQEAVLIAASKEGERVYRSLGFAPNLALVYGYPALDTQTEADTPIPQEEANRVDKDLWQRLHGSNARIKIALETATTRQLLAVFDQHAERDTILESVATFQKKEGTYVDPANNWFTNNLSRFGKGFNMKNLAEDEDKLARKFDRLAGKYDHWTVGNQSRVERFIVESYRKHLEHGENRDTARILDVACGIGLQGQVLRLCGFGGELTGCDVSSKMVERVIERGCYEHAFVANANKGIFDKGAADNASLYDVVICTGAMELLDHDLSLSHISDIMQDDGLLWVSFQLATSDGECPTVHQSVAGLAREEIFEVLQKHGFGVVSAQECVNAFYTPSPKQDGTLLAVPYLFRVAQKEVSYAHNPCCLPSSS